MAYGSGNNTWENYPSTSTPITAERLNKIEKFADDNKQRLDNLAKLPSGATTGDAELADIRVGADGKTYTNAGEAVREQLKNTNTKVDENHAELKEETSQLESNLVHKPSGADDGKIPRAKEGEVEWVEIGQPTDVQTENAVTKWLDGHPEATTTVQNHSLSIDKMVLGTLEYVTPKMFGAVGDGMADDSDAFFKALNYCNTNKKTLVINDMTLNLQTIPKLAENKDAIFVISCNVKSRQSKIIFNINSGDTIGSAFLVNGNDIEIDGVSIKNQSEAKNRYFLISFKKCKNVNFNKCYISDEVQRDTNLPNMVTGFIDISEQNNNLKLINSVFVNKNSTSGGIWIRESTEGATTQNIAIKDCIIQHSCCDESLAIWGFKGKVENILVENNLFIEEKRKQNGGIAIFTLHQSGLSDNIIFANNEIIIEDECEFIYIFLQRFSENAGITKILNNTINVKLNSKMKSSYGLFNNFNSFNDIIKDNIILLQNGTDQTDIFTIFRDCKNVINNKIIGKELNNTNVVISLESYLSNNNIDVSCPISFYGTKIPLLENNIITAPSAINGFLFNAVYGGFDNFNFIIRGNYIDLNAEAKLNIDCNNKSNLFIINNYFPKIIVQSNKIQKTYIACNNILKRFSVTTPTVNSNNILITKEGFN